MPATRRAASCPPAPRGGLTVWLIRWRRLTPLAREVTVILVIKVAVLALIWFAFFRAPAAPRMHMDPLRVERALLAPTPVPEASHAER
jgi:hypothetical protein